MELVQADGVHAEGLQRRLGGLAQVGRGPIHGPRAVTGPDVAALGRDQHVAGVPAVGGQSPGDEPLVVPGLRGFEVIGIGRVDQRDPGVQGGMDGGDGALLLRPALDRHGHPAQADGADRDAVDGPRAHWCSSCGCCQVSA